MRLARGATLHLAPALTSASGIDRSGSGQGSPIHFGTGARHHASVNRSICGIRKGSDLDAARCESRQAPPPYPSPAPESVQVFERVCERMIVSIKHWFEAMDFELSFLYFDDRIGLIDDTRTRDVDRDAVCVRPWPVRRFCGAGGLARCSRDTWRSYPRAQEGLAAAEGCKCAH